MSEKSALQALEWIESQIIDGFDVTFSRLHDHSVFGDCVCVCRRHGYDLPTRNHDKTVLGAINVAKNVGSTDER